jgi:uncharacterized protein
MATVRCPNCKTPVRWGPDSPYRPFCSERCRMIDLGAWIDGSNSIPGNELEEHSLGTVDVPHDPANE